MLVDTHCHLDFPEFENDLEGIVARAKSAGVEQMITIATYVDKFDRYAALADRFDNVFFSVGTHPHNAATEAHITTDTLVSLAKSHPKVVAIGEFGLDYHYKPEESEAQKQGMHRHIEAACELDLPVIIHARDADDDMIALLHREMKRAPFRGVLHCFSSGERLADAGIEMGLYVSFSGIVTFKNAKTVQAVAEKCPQDRLLVETDAPYLAPPPYRGQRNEPAYVAQTAAFLAQLRGVSLQELAATTTANAKKLFRHLGADHAL